jgi:acetoin:2,6-dichlorophenolindophenol oxidoreductase subunit beta
VATSSMVIAALKAADMLQGEGISVEVVDPRTLVPLDRQTLRESARKTGHVVVVDEGYPRYSVTGELASVIYEEAFDYLDSPVVRIGAADCPVPFSPVLEFASFPTADQIAQTIREVLRG